MFVCLCAYMHTQILIYDGWTAFWHFFYMSGMSQGNQKEWCTAMNELPHLSLLFMKIYDTRPGNTGSMHWMHICMHILLLSYGFFFFSFFPLLFSFSFFLLWTEIALYTTRKSAGRHFHVYCTGLGECCLRDLTKCYCNNCNCLRIFRDKAPSLY